ncbi:MAG: PhzF family phenazine biosynthesis protein [Acidimicrobiaceae bacterium]|nr:PhzF family phenazine biosynthesis protein [Acidimicrobiaceae bacterium]
MLRDFVQVDVFGADPYLGNPLAVVIGGEGLDEEEMQRFARWTNLSETTFLLPPTSSGADYRVRIFTPNSELPFAGHPTLGSCHAWLEAGGTPRAEDRVVQECQAGLVPVRRTPSSLAFAAPPLVRSGPVEREVRDEITRTLGIAPAEIVDATWADNGPGWVAVLLRDANTVLGLQPTGAERSLGVVGPFPPGGAAAVEVRAFSPLLTTLEDPVTGSLNAAIAPWLLDTGVVTAPYVVSQGTAIGRRGRVHVDRDADGTVWVGGATTTLVRGQVAL